MFWRLVHRLPWRFTRHICDSCDEFPFDPRDDAAWGRAERGNVKVALRPRVVGAAWSCPHMTITASGITSAPKVPCGCVMQPLTATR